MGTYQTDYSTSPAKGLPGQIANEEKCNKVSRTVESAVGIAFGQPAFRGAGDHGVVVGAAFAATAVGAADAGNAGAGAITASPAVAAGAKQGAYKVIQIAGGATGAFNVYDPDGVFIGNGAVGTEFVGGGLTFTVTDPGTDPAIGDSYTVTVTYTANGKFVGLAVLSEAVPPSASAPDAYPQYFTGAFMTMGSMYVTAGAGGVVDGGDVYWQPATSRYNSVATGVRIPDAVFDTTGADGDIVEVSLKLR
ncbi:hypothetical protein [Sphingobium sp. ZW T5_29]|uniref:structural cement protein Gp24 n=1 Tax=Sphingobium sp. ZW T5_29 TaxID=3378077 RepID=UPI0038529B3A